jgi:hypothetical protein
MLSRSLPGHITLALTTGLVCGVVSARYHTVILPPYAAILGALVAYPALVAICGVCLYRDEAVDDDEGLLSVAGCRYGSRLDRLAVVLSIAAGRRTSRGGLRRAAQSWPRRTAVEPTI